MKFSRFIKTVCLALVLSFLSEQLSFAAAEGRVLYSANVGDFARLHAEWLRSERVHAGLILRSWQQMPIGLQLEGLLAINAAFDRDAMASSLIYMSDFLRGPAQ